MHSVNLVLGSLTMSLRRMSQVKKWPNLGLLWFGFKVVAFASLCLRVKPRISKRLVLPWPLFPFFRKYQNVVKEPRDIHTEPHSAWQGWPCCHQGASFLQIYKLTTKRSLIQRSRENSDTTSNPSMLLKSSRSDSWDALRGHGHRGVPILQGLRHCRRPWRYPPPSWDKQPLLDLFSVVVKDELSFFLCRYLLLSKRPWPSYWRSIYRNGDAPGWLCIVYSLGCVTSRLAGCGQGDGPPQGDDGPQVVLAKCTIIQCNCDT